MINLGDAVLFFKGDYSDIDKSESHISDISRSIGVGFTAMGGAITAGLGFALKAFADSESSGLQLDAVLKSTGGAAGVTKDSIVSLATELQKTTLFEDDAVIAADALLLTFTSIGKDIFPTATKTMLDMSQALGQGLKDSAIQLGKALNDPIQGMTALRRVGVSFTEEQIAQVKVMQESGDLMGAQKLILGELEKEFGGSATEAAQGLAGEWVHLKNSFGDLMEDIGSALSGGKGFQGLIEMVTNAVKATDEWVKENPELSSTLVTIAGAVGGLMLALGPVLIALPGIVTAVGLVGGAFSALALGPALAIAAAIAGVGVAGYELAQNWDSITGAVSDWTKPKFAAKEAGSVIASDWDAWLNQVVNTDEGAKLKLADYSKVKASMEQSTNEMSSIWYKLGEDIAWAFTHPFDVIQSVVSAIVAVVEGAILAILVPIYAVEKEIAKVFSMIGGGFLGGFMSGLDPSAGTVEGQESIFRASGGPVSGGSPYIVGEEGPEMFVPNTSGRIINARDTAQAGAGSTVNVSFPNLIIREEADIDRISKLIARQIPMALTGAMA